MADAARGNASSLQPCPCRPALICFKHSISSFLSSTSSFVLAVFSPPVAPPVAAPVALPVASPPVAQLAGA